MKYYQKNAKMTSGNFGLPIFTKSSTNLAGNQSSKTWLMSNFDIMTSFWNPFRPVETEISYLTIFAYVTDRQKQRRDDLCNSLKVARQVVPTLTI